MQVVRVIGRARAREHCMSDARRPADQPTHSATGADQGAARDAADQRSEWNAADEASAWNTADKPAGRNAADKPVGRNTANTRAEPNVVNERAEWNPADAAEAAASLAVQGLQATEAIADALGSVLRGLPGRLRELEVPRVVASAKSCCRTAAN